MAVFQCVPLKTNLFETVENRILIQKLHYKKSNFIAAEESCIVMFILTKQNCPTWATVLCPFSWDYCAYSSTLTPWPHISLCSFWPMTLSWWWEGRSTSWALRSTYLGPWSCTWISCAFSCFFCPSLEEETEIPNWRRAIPTDKLTQSLSSTYIHGNTHGIPHTSVHAGSVLPRMREVLIHTVKGKIENCKRCPRCNVFESTSSIFTIPLYPG